MPRRSLGFTLIELMVTVAIAAVMMTVAAPSLVAFQRTAELTSRTNSLLASINTARSEAMKRGRNAMVIPYAGGVDWHMGMIVFVDLDGNNVYDAASDLTVFQITEPMPDYMFPSATGSASGATPYMRFNAQGYARLTDDTAGNFTFTIENRGSGGIAVPGQTRRIIVAKTGRARSCNPDTSAATACQASNSE